MNGEELIRLITTAGTGWLPGPSHRSGIEACPECGSDSLENGSYASDGGCWIVTRCRRCGYKHTLSWTE